MASEESKKGKSNKDFVHIHLHTEYSLLDGMSKIGDLFEHVKEQGMDSVAITDHGVMYGAIEFYQKAQKHEVKPLLGMEAYTTNVPLDSKPERGKFKNFHLLLLAKNNVGYKNLMKLTSIGQVDGYYYRPRITREILAKHSEGIICTSACPAGELASALIEDDWKKAKETAQWFVDVFGDDYYLEVQRHEYHKHVPNAPHPDIKKDLEMMVKNEKIINDGVMKLSGELGIPVVATNDAHYIKKEHATAQDSLVCIATGKDVSDIQRLRFIDTPEYYVKSPEQMYELFPDIPEACENTVKVAEKCHIEIKLGEWFFPKVEIPKGKTAEETLRERTYAGMKEKYAEITPELQKRVDYELKVILDKGYPEYFLIYEDMANWAKGKKIPINTRGSAAGSVVSYCLGITSVDPIRFLLPFERFLNPFRPSAPDIDMDISDTKREEMIAYLTERYGKEKVAQICTFGRMLAKGAVRDVARVLGYPYAKGDMLSKLIPPGAQGFPMTIDRAMDESPDFKYQYENDVDSKKIIDLAKQIEGNARHVSVHAAGVVISPTKMTDFSPVQREPSGDKVKIITQYEMHACEDIGLVKLDVLGIRNLSILEESVHWVEKTTGKEVVLSELPLDDKKTFETLARGETFGVFQLGNSGMTKWLMELAPETIDDINAMIALYRPGPMANIPEYIDRKRGKPFEYYHPKMASFLDKSFGILVYQDDLLYTALELAGYNWEEVDKFRKAVGKKIPEEMAKQHIKFVDGCQKVTGMTKEEAEGLWELFEPFQGYGFNKAHSASYGLISYQTAYMKTNYPVEYMCALLTAESGDTDKISAAIAECRRMGVTVLPPDINESDIGFKVVKAEDSIGGQGIRFGLSAIKNVGEAAINSILDEREDGEFNSFADFLSRVDGRKVNKRVLESLIKVGALSDFGTRASLIENLEEIRGKVSKPQGMENQQGLFSDEDMQASMRSETANLNLSATEYSEEELENLERELMGFALSARPLDELLSGISPSATHKVYELTDDGVPLQSGRKVKLACIIDEVRVVITKRGNKEMAFVRVKDDTGGVDLVVFPDMYSENREALVENNPVLVSGKIDFREDSVNIIAEEIDTEESAAESDVLYVRIPAGVTAEHLQKLKRALNNSPGEQSVTLIFEGNEDKRVDLPITVTWDEVLASQISEILRV